MNRLPFLLVLFLFASGVAPVATAATFAAPRFTDEVIYFVLVDRFANGNPANDGGIYPPGTSQARTLGGFDPTSRIHYHGGDFAGLQSRLDYLEELGVTALWLNPIFRNQWVQFGSAAYHGYWITDFLNVDPHYGTNEEFRQLVEAAHARGIRIILDIVCNHTADVIQYQEQQYTYRDKATWPYRDSAGLPFDDRDFVGVGAPAFPLLDSNVSFPYRPLVPPALADAKNPAWLNDLTVYHNRGDSTFSGENSVYGDFFGLDDLFTEQERVVEGFIEIFSYWVDEYKVDGFRIDTVKHVNREFWLRFGPALHEAAVAAGIDHFFQFGEVFSYDARLLSEFARGDMLDSVLDFPLQGALRAFVLQGADARVVADVFAQDDYYRGPDRSPRSLPTFNGNHDIGRWGHFVRSDQPGASFSDQVALARLGHGLLFFLRGIPVLYYGDEQGFTGTGGDAEARQDMFPSRVQADFQQTNLGGVGTPAINNFNTQHPVFSAIAEQARVYHAHAALRRGVQETRDTGSPRVLGMSRILPGEDREYLVLANNAAQPVAVEVLVASPAGTRFAAIYPEASSTQATVANEGRLALTVPRYGLLVLRAEAMLPSATAPVSVTFTEAREGRPLFFSDWEQDGQAFPGRVLVGAATEPASRGTMTFFWRPTHTEAWTLLGIDPTPPYRVYVPRPEVFDPSARYDLRATFTTGDVVRGEAVVTGISLQEGAAPSHWIIHLDDDVADPEGWQVRVSGPAVGTTLTVPFIGEAEASWFAAVPLADAFTPAALEVLAPDGSPLFAPAVTLEPWRLNEVWVAPEPGRWAPSAYELHGLLDLVVPLASGSSVRTLRIAQDDDSGDERLLFAALSPVAESGGARRFRVASAEAEAPLDPTVLLRVTALDAGGSALATVLVDPRAAPQIWLDFAAARAASTPGALNDVVTLRYRRPAGDYGNTSSSNFQDFWGLHVWEGAASPNPSWQEPLKSATVDRFGQVYTVAVEPDADRLAYLLHRGDAKDPGPDQFLDLAGQGHTVWQLQGADPAAPYVLRRGWLDPQLQRGDGLPTAAFPLLAGFSDSAYLGTTRYDLPPFGEVDATWYPWLFWRERGFFYFSAAQAGGFWLIDDNPQLGLFWSSSELWPWLFRWSDRQFLYYFPGSGAWFWNPVGQTSVFID